MTPAVDVDSVDSMDNPSATLTPLQVTQAFFDANEGGDPAAVRALFASDATYVIPGDPELVPWVGERDRDGIADYMRELAAHAEFDHFEVTKILVDGEDVVALGRFAMHFASGGRLDDPYAIHLVVRDGLIRSYVMHEDSLNLARELTGRTAPGTLPVAD